MAFTLRDAQPDDLETLWKIDQSCFPKGIAYSQRELKYFMNRRGLFTLIAVDDTLGTVAGFIIAESGLLGHVITIDVVQDTRRSGLGSQLLGTAEERLRQAGSRAVGLETAVDNLGALSFYKRHGYEVMRTLPRYYANGVDALLLKKDFDGPGAKRSEC
ncbi:MAG TPA: N-acetyltransferase [Candidatus Sulfotelmatobacter sp.]